MSAITIDGHDIAVLFSENEIARRTQEIARDIAASAGVGHEVLDKSLADYAELMAQGYGDEDVSAVIRLKRRKR